jgi:hypothetical protein
LGPSLAHGKTPKPVWVDSTGKQLGPLGFSDGIAQGVVLKVTGTTGTNQSVSLWVLVPFTPGGVGYDTYFAPTYGPTMIYNQLFFPNNNCQGNGYILAPSLKQLRSNSETNPYSAFMGAGELSIFFPFGPPHLGTALGIASSYVGLALPAVGYTGPCEPALPAPGEYFAPVAAAALDPTYFQNQGFTPPWSVVVP